MEDNGIKKNFLLKPSKTGLKWGLSITQVLLVSLFLMIPFLMPLKSGMGGIAAGHSINYVLPTPKPTDGAENSTATPTETPEITLTPAPIEAVRLLYSAGDSAEEIKTVQMRLVELGYLSSDEPSDYFNASLESAVILFQRTHNLLQSGDIDEDLWELICSDSALEYVIQQGDRGNDVKMLQSRLAALGYYHDKQNGYFGLATRDALELFQAMNGLVVDGSADSFVIDMLYSYDVVYSNGTVAAPIPMSTPRPTVAPKPSQTPKPTQIPGPSQTPESTQAPNPTDGTSPTSEPKPTATPKPTEPLQTPAPVGGVEGFIKVLKDQLGKPYVYGMEGPDSFDCSGLIYYCLNEVGIHIGRLNAAGYANISSWDRVDSENDLRRGDLIFTKTSSGRIDHVGVYLGSGKYIHASTSSGAVVISTWNDWMSDRFSHGRRIWS